VAVDIRSDSETYLKWHSEIVNPDNNKTQVISEGFAHGFQTLTSDCETLYLRTCAYNPDAEGGLNPEDPAIGIEWPLEIAQISDRDKKNPFVNSVFTGVCL
jgi:dTDP-4-dehydrorhamnose 3,5-epimerase